MKVLITGANGFLGSHLVEKSLEKGFETTAVMRTGSDRSNLSELSGYHTLEIDYSSVDAIASALSQLEKHDLVIHNAGLTKSYTLDRYLLVNVDLTEKLIRAIAQTELMMETGRFAYISSLAAKGPVGHSGPASNYGRSKVMAENKIKESGINYMIFRPAGIYGVRDVQFVPLIKAAKLGLYPLMSSPQHKMTLINARDVAENVIECSLKHVNQTVHLEDGNVYLHRDLQNILQSALGKKTRTLKVGKPIIKSMLFLSDLLDKTLNRTPTLSLEHYSEISQDWDYDFSEERNQVPLTIHYPLQKGFQEAIDYYSEKGLI